MARVSSSTGGPGLEVARVREPSRRRRGIAQNFANQLAQLLVGWQIGADGPVLGSGPSEGLLQIDLVARVSTRDGVPVQLAIADHAFTWIDEELRRRSLPAEWLKSGNGHIRFERGRRIPGTVLRPELHPGVALRSEVHVDTDFGSAEATSTNGQVLWRV